MKKIRCMYLMQLTLRKFLLVLKRDVTSSNWSKISRETNERALTIVPQLTLHCLTLKTSVHLPIPCILAIQSPWGFLQRKLLTVKCFINFTKNRVGNWKNFTTIAPFGTIWNYFIRSNDLSVLLTASIKISLAALVLKYNIDLFNIEEL